MTARQLPSFSSANLAHALIDTWGSRHSFLQSKYIHWTAAVCQTYSGKSKINNAKFLSLSSSVHGSHRHLCKVCVVVVPVSSIMEQGGYRHKTTDSAGDYQEGFQWMWNLRWVMTNMYSFARQRIIMTANIRCMISITSHSSEPFT